MSTFGVIRRCKVVRVIALRHCGVGKRALCVVGVTVLGNLTAFAGCFLQQASNFGRIRTCVQINSELATMSLGRCELERRELEQRAWERY